ncbi:hypothetical protein Micbo1qcDRAFT_163314, partial [Microdochium bolleyi]
MDCQVSEVQYSQLSASFLYHRLASRSSSPLGRHSAAAYRAAAGPTGPRTSNMPLMLREGSRIGPRPPPRLPNALGPLNVLLLDGTVAAGSGSNRSSHGESGPSASAWSHVTKAGAGNVDEAEQGVMGEEPSDDEDTEDGAAAPWWKYAASKSWMLGVLVAPPPTALPLLGSMELGRLMRLYARLVFVTGGLVFRVGDIGRSNMARVSWILSRFLGTINDDRLELFALGVGGACMSKAVMSSAPSLLRTSISDERLELFGLGVGGASNSGRVMSWKSKSIASIIDERLELLGLGLDGAWTPRAPTSWNPKSKSCPSISDDRFELLDLGV